MDYILYLAQEANFQTRSMLIPADEFLKVRKEDYLLLKKYAVDNILIQNYIWEGNMGKQELHPYTKTINELTRYADGMEGYFDMKDEIWYDNSIIGFCKGFNHIKNYHLWINKKEIRGKPVNIIDSFLVLNTDNNQLNVSSVDTVEEMFEKYYL